MRWWVALPVASGASIAGAVADLQVEGALRWVFGIAYVVGCMAAVLAVSGPGLLAAMAEPPAVALGAVGVATVLSGRASSGSATALAVGARLTTLFPLMAGVTAVAVLLGLGRLWRHRTAVRSF